MTAKEANRRSRQGQAAAIKHEPALKAKYEAVLRANAKRVARAYKTTGITAAGKVPTLDEVLAEAALASSATARTKVERQRIAEESAAPLITDAGKRELRKLVEPIVARQAGAQAERIVAGVKDRVAAIMLESLIEGYSVPDTASLLQANLELDAIWQAEMLARTDLISLSNAASHEAAASLEDGPKFKTWLSAGDNRVRPTHVDANGQVVPIDQPYLLEGVELQYPGDPNGPDGETINCRCVSVFTDTSTAILRPSSQGGIQDEPVTQFDAPVAAAGYTESLHPRFHKGLREGGRFAPKAGTSTAGVQAQAEQAAADAQKSEDIAAVEKVVADQRLESLTTEELRRNELNRFAVSNGVGTTEPGLAGEVGNVTKMNLNATNPVYTGDLDGTKVVVKPEVQLSPTQLRTHVEPGFDLEREQAAAHIGQLLREDTPTVAPNVLSYEIRDVDPFGKSGVTPFIEGNTLSRLPIGEAGAALAPDIRKIRFYDGIIGNTDRHDGNVMIGPASRVYAIDHGLAFPSVNQEGWSNIQGGYLETSLSGTERGALERLRPKLRTDATLPTLLTADQIQAMDDRIGFMLHNGRMITKQDWEDGFSAN